MPAAHHRPPPSRWPATGRTANLPETAGVVVAAIGVAVSGWVWSVGELAGRLHSGRWPRVGLRQLVGILAALPSRPAHPELAWPASCRVQLPGPVTMYLLGAGLLALPAIGAVWRLRRGPVGPAGPAEARWARGGDLSPVRVGRRSRHRLVVGALVARGAGRQRIGIEARHSVLVMGPTQSGKTTGLAIPAIFDWAGPVLATSVKDDLVSVTRPARSASSGPCWVFDPTASSGSENPARWSPLGACRSWSAAQRVASWLVEATPSRTGLADAAFWYATAAKQLAPLLLAAASQELGMAAVVAWTNAGDFDGPGRILWAHSEEEAAQALAACAGRDDRIRSSVTTTLETVLAPFEDPQVALSTGACDISPADLLAGRGTLYLCGPSHEQHRVQGLFAALVSAVVDEAIRQVTTTGHPLDPPLLLVLDEAANIAPVRDLDTLASTGAGLGIQLVTVCQDLSQLSARYGAERSRTIVNNHRAKVLLSGVSDLATLDLVSGLAGEAAVRQHSFTHDLRDGRRTHSAATVYRRLAPTDELRRIPPGEGVLVYGHLPPVRIRLRPWFRDRRLRRLGPVRRLD